VLLEPWTAFELTVPQERAGRALSDIRLRGGSAAEEVSAGGELTLRGRAPLRTMQEYADETASYTGGRGRLRLRPDGYDVCLNAEEVTAAFGYVPESDRDNPPESVFCRNGGGFAVPWDQVPDHMHLPRLLPVRTETRGERRGHGGAAAAASDEELEAIMLREFGPIKRPQAEASPRTVTAAEYRMELKEPEALLVDGYNLIFFWDELKEAAGKGLDYARGQLEVRLQNYAAFTGRSVTLVFDGWRVAGGTGSVEERQPLEIVYTAENETADMFIERFLAEKKTRQQTAVVSNDNLIRLAAIRLGALRVGCEQFVEEYREAMAKLRAASEERGTAFTPVISPEVGDFSHLEG